MKRLLCLFVVIASCLSKALAATLPPCLGGLSVSTFRLLLEAKGKGPALLLSTVNIIQPGDKLKYEPIHVPAGIKDKAQVAILLVPAPKPSKEEEEVAGTRAAGAVLADPSAATSESGKGVEGGVTSPGTAGSHQEKGKEKSKEKQKDLVVLEARPAKSPAEWVIPARVSIVGVVFGPHGLNIKKVSSMVEKNADLIPQLADYAQQTATVQALVKMLSQVEESPTSGTDLNAALRGFSAEYGLAVPKLDPAAPTNLQAGQLLQAVLPPLSSYDPLTAENSAVVAQSTGLASSVAALFFGTPVGLAAGGAALFENLRVMMFPDTDFHAAFTQSVANDGLALCSKDQSVKPRTRPAYLWILRIPDAGMPAVSLPETFYLPLGWKSALKVACAKPDQLKTLSRVRDWQLVSSAHSAGVPVTVTVGTPNDTLEMDLSHAKLTEGQYRLAAKWDWDPLEVKGAINLRPFGDFSRAKLSADSEDHLVEGTGPLKIQLTGADFEFISKVALAPSGDDMATTKELSFKELSFTLPKRSGNGEQTTLEVDVDTSELRAGPYILKLTQTNGTTHDLAIVIHPPNPTLSNLPLRVNLEEPQQTIILEGSRLERIEGLSSEGATWTLPPVPAGAKNLSERKVTVKLLAHLKKGERLEANMEVEQLHSPLKIPDVLRVAGPRPKITRASESAAQTTDVELRPGELAAGSPLSFAIQTENAGSYPTFDLGCTSTDDVKKPLTLHPGDRIGTAQLDFTGEGNLFLSMDPGTVGYPGCQLVATVTNADTGASDPYILGLVIRLPHIVSFQLTQERKGGQLYIGTLTGQDLQTIDKTGWHGENGYPVQGIPTPVAANPQEQTLKIELPWPPPSPRAPVYVWLRGETQGRITGARY
jgi:hypothetical protein